MFPELVAFGKDGQPEAVYYHILPAMLLNELQKQQRTIDAQAAAIDALMARLERFEAVVPSIGVDRQP
jgi:hypothetical protein